MRMTDRMALELKKQFELKAAQYPVGQCMDCDDHPDEKFDGYCSVEHQLEGYISTVLNVTDELLRYKAINRKRKIGEPTEREFSDMTVDEELEGNILDWFAALTAQMEAVRDEHETQMDGSYHRHSCAICNAHRLLEGPTVEVERLTKENELLQEEMEEARQQFDEALLRGDGTRIGLTRAIGFFTRSPAEMTNLVTNAVRFAMKDPEFKAKYDEKKADSRRRALDAIQKAQETKELMAQVEKLTKDLAVVEDLVTNKKDPRVHPSVLADLKERAREVSEKLAENQK